MRVYADLSDGQLAAEAAALKQEQRAIASQLLKLELRLDAERHALLKSLAKMGVKAAVAAAAFSTPIIGIPALIKAIGGAIVVGFDVDELLTMLRGIRPLPHQIKLLRFQAEQVQKELELIHDEMYGTRLKAFRAGAALRGRSKGLR